MGIRPMGRLAQILLVLLLVARAAVSHAPPVGLVAVAGRVLPRNTLTTRITLHPALPGIIRSRTRSRPIKASDSPTQPTPRDGLDTHWATPREASSCRRMASTSSESSVQPVEQSACTRRYATASASAAKPNSREPSIQEECNDSPTALNSGKRRQGGSAHEAYKATGVGGEGH